MSELVWEKIDFGISAKIDNQLSFEISNGMLHIENSPIEYVSLCYGDVLKLKQKAEKINQIIRE